MRRDWDSDGGGGGGALVVSGPGVVVEAADCGGGSHREERSVELMKASITEELSSVHRFMVGGERYSVIPCTVWGNWLRVKSLVAFWRLKREAEWGDGLGGEKERERER